MALRKGIGALVALSLLVPGAAGAASLSGDASGGLALSVGTDVRIHATSGPAYDDSSDAAATGTPSADSADDDSNLEAGATLRTNGLGVTILSSSQVATDDDLIGYEENMRAEDEYFAKADLTTDSDVSVSYRHDGRLFGIFPVKVESKTRVYTDAEGQSVVKTSMPWWNLFVTGTGSVASRIDNNLAGSGTIASDIKLGGSAAAKARILEAVMRAHADARVSADI